MSVAIAVKTRLDGRRPGWSNNLYDQYRFNQVAGGMFAEYLKCDVKKGENFKVNSF